MDVKKIKHHRDNVYLNIVIDPIEANGAQNTIAKYDQTLTIPVINNPSDYYCSVVRFSLPIDTIPLFKWPVDVQQNNPNLSYLTLGVTNGANLFLQNVVYVPANNLTPPTALGSAPFFSNEQSTGAYYDMFSIQAMLNMFNTALAAAVTASGLGVAPPYYLWDPVTELISLFVPSTFQATGEEIVINRYTKNFLNSFNFWLDTTSIADNFLYYHQLDPLPPLVSGLYQFREEYVSIGLWLDIRKILIQTTTIPVIAESLPNQVTTNISQYAPQTGLNAFVPIISDFVISYDQVNQISSILVYNPTAQYRLIDMNSHTPLQKIDLQFYYQDKFGNRFPIYISPTQQASVKIAFLKRDLYHS